MEYHPEEDHDCKDEEQGHDALFGLGRGEFRTCGSGGFGGSGELAVGEDVGVGAASEEVDQEADDERAAGDGECVAVTRGEG